MSDCGICIGDYCDGEAADFYTKAIRTARKPHQCYECFDTIAPGDRYEFLTAKWDGAIQTAHTCLACVDIAESLSCDGSRMHGGLWIELEELKYDLGQGCLEKVKTAAGKEKLRAFINRVKGL